MSDTTASSGRSPVVVVGAIVAGVLLLGLLWFLVISPLLGGDEDGEPFDPRAGLPEATEPAAPTEEASDDEEVLAALPIETYEIFLSRDPFEPVVPAPDAGAGAGEDTDGDGVPDVIIIDTDGDGVPDGTDSDGDGVPDGTDGDGDGVPDDGAVQHNAVLIDVFTDESGRARALIRVDDRIFTVSEGQIFADDYAVVAIDGTCVTLTFEGAAFTLCEGGGSGQPGDGSGGGTGAEDGPCRGDGEVVCEGRVVTLIDVFTDREGAVAVVQVDSTVYEVRRGDNFAQNFQVVSVDPPCVTLLYGDDAFTLCEGERTLK